MLIGPPDEIRTSLGDASSAGVQAKGVQSLVPLDRFEGTLARRVYLSLREAIGWLAAERLVDVLPQSGTFVSRLYMTEIRQGTFIREALELAAIEQVAHRVSDDQVRLLKHNMRLQQVMLEDKNQAGFYELDKEMHELILSFTGYPRLHEIAGSVRSQVDRVRHLVLPPPGHVEDAYREHQAIVDALEKRDPALARQALRHHLNQLLTRLDRVAKEQPDLFQGSA